MHRTRTSKTKPGQELPQWILDCAQEVGSKHSSIGNVMRTMFSVGYTDEIGLRTERSVAAGTVAIPDVDGIASLLSKGPDGPLDWLAADAEGHTAKFMAKHHTSSRVSKGYAYYMVHRRCGPPSWNALDCMADIFNAVQVLAARRWMWWCCWQMGSLKGLSNMRGGPLEVQECIPWIGWRL